MYNIVFYKNENGESDVKDFIRELKTNSDKSKDAKINLRKVIAYIRVLRRHGNSAGMPFLRHLQGEIWEIRPISNRILYAYFDDETIILLHHFIKRSKKTPRREIERAMNEIADYKRRNE